MFLQLDMSCTNTIFPNHKAVDQRLRMIDRTLHFSVWIIDVSGSYTDKPHDGNLKDKRMTQILDFQARTNYGFD